MKSILLVMPVYRRFELTRIMLNHMVDTFGQAESLGVICQCVCIGDDDNLQVAEDLGFAAIEAPNVLGAKYNDGHESAVQEGYDFSFQVNSDQAFDPKLLAAIAESPTDSIISTSWITAVYRSGKKAISYQNPMWAMMAYPTDLLRNNPRPCEENIESMCDTSVRAGVIAANPGVPEHRVSLHPGETIQFESGMQMTPWKRHLFTGMLSSTLEMPVPWTAIEELHGRGLTDAMKEFYGQV